ncbi:unnamed protein product [Coffea canephora]|uniref:Uncharacterized protein n=1 Tax=Coffea canephora TaxID=49390 RepID=A0A068VCW0_COFCA|nr:unnamed protein product [Coffea canephora]
MALQATSVSDVESSHCAETLQKAQKCAQGRVSLEPLKHLVALFTFSNSNMRLWFPIFFEERCGEFF